MWKSITATSETSDSTQFKPQKRSTACSSPATILPRHRMLGQVWQTPPPAAGTHCTSRLAQWSRRPTTQGGGNSLRAWPRFPVIRPDKRSQLLSDWAAHSLLCPRAHGMEAGAAHRGSLGCSMNIMDAAPPPQGSCFRAATAIAVFCCAQESKAA